MLLYLQIQMTIISWHTHPTPSRAVQEENSSPRNPCKLPVISPRISTRAKVIERILNLSVAACERSWSGQSAAVWDDPVRGERRCWCTRVLAHTRPGSAAQLGEGSPQPAWAASINWHTNTALRTSPDTPVSAPTKQGLTANTRWCRTAPKQLLRHVNVCTPSQELGCCVQ